MSQPKDEMWCRFFPFWFAWDDKPLLIYEYSRKRRNEKYTDKDIAVELS